MDIKNDLIEEFIKLRGYYFNACGEDLDKFNSEYKNHELHDSVVSSLNTSFRDVHQTALNEIEKFLASK